MIVMNEEATKNDLKEILKHYFWNSLGNDLFCV